MYPLRRTGLVNQNKIATGWPFANVITVSQTDLDADYSTIAAAITAAVAGDVIEIDPGSYTETLTVNKAITLRGRDRNNTEITSSTTNTRTVSLTLADAKLLNLKITHTTTGLFGYCVGVSANDCIIENCILEMSSAANTNKAIENTGGTGLIVRETEMIISGGTAFNRCYDGHTAANDVEFIRCKLDASGTGAAEISMNHANAVATITETVLVNGTVTINANLGVFNGTLQDAFLVKNVDGAPAVFGDVGFLDVAGEYQTTNNEGDNVAWCAVVIGNDDDDNIFIKRQGNVVVNYVGGAPSAGDFLITSTTGGSATQQTTMHPAIFAVCTANGAGGTVAAQLLTGTTTRMFTAATDTVRVFTSSDSDFVATINGAPVGAAVIYNAPTSGSDDTIDPLSSAEVGKIVLHNTTRGDSALISDVNTGTNTITLTAAAPGAWANTDTITARSQTVTGALIGTSRAYDLDLSGFLPELVRSASFSLFHAESTPGANNFSFMQEFSTSAPSFSLGDLISAAVAGGIQAVKLSPHQIFDKKVCFLVSASGVATSGIIIRIRSIDIATP